MNLKNYSRLTAQILIISLIYTGILTAFTVYQQLEINKLKTTEPQIILVEQ